MLTLTGRMTSGHTVATQTAKDEDDAQAIAAEMLDRPSIYKVVCKDGDNEPVFKASLRDGIEHAEPKSAQPVE